MSLLFRRQSSLRSIVFRILAGALAILFAMFLIFGDQSQLTWYKLVGLWVVTVGLTVFSVFGSEAMASRIMLAWFGHGLPTSRQDETNEREP